MNLNIWGKDSFNDVVDNRQYLHGYLVISRRGLVELYGAVARRAVQVIFGQRDRNDVDGLLIHGSSLSMQALYALPTGPLEHFTEGRTADCQKNKGNDRCEDPERNKNFAMLRGSFSVSMCADVILWPIENRKWMDHARLQLWDVKWAKWHSRWARALTLFTIFYFFLINDFATLFFLLNSTNKYKRYKWNKQISGRCNGSQVQNAVMYKWNRLYSILILLKLKNSDKSRSDLVVFYFIYL